MQIKKKKKKEDFPKKKVLLCDGEPCVLVDAIDDPILITAIVCARSGSQVISSNGI